MMPATDAAMVSALAPGSVAVTAMVGKSTFGSAETGNSRKPNTPNAMIEAVSSVVMTGRRMQSSESVIASRPCLGRARRDGGSFRQQQLAIGNDVLAAGQSALDDRKSLKGAPDIHGLDVRLAVLHDEDVVAVLAALHGGRRHRYGLLGPDHELGVDQNSRPQRFVLVVHDAAHGDHAGGGIHRV